LSLVESVLNFSCLSIESVPLSFNFSWTCHST